MSCGATVLDQPAAHRLHEGAGRTGSGRRVGQADGREVATSPYGKDSDTVPPTPHRVVQQRRREHGDRAGEWLLLAVYLVAAVEDTVHPGAR